MANLSQGLNVTLIVRSFLFFSLLFSQVYATESLRFIGEVNFNTGTIFQETQLGGLSGITFDKEQNKLLAISDDKSWISETRFYEFDLNLTQTSFKVIPLKVVKLKKADGSYFQKDEADFEGISLLNNDILISSEGNSAQTPSSSSQLYRFFRNGTFKDMIPVPEKFIFKKSGNTIINGTRDNKGFETLSSSSDAQITMMAAEDALYQDGDVASTVHASTTRIIIYKDLKPISEIAYRLEKIQTQKNDESVGASDNGLVDIAVIDDKNFYALERMWLSSVKKNIIRIYKCKVTTSTTDISKLMSLKSEQINSVEKVLVADLDSFTTQMKPKALDNIEGLSFGPKLPNGAQSVIVVSDNNFSPNQRTLFMAFELIEK